MRISFVLFLILSLSACGKFRIFKKSSQEKQDVSHIYARGNLTIAVFYEEGAEPYTDGVSVLAGLPEVKVWSVLESNLKAMFPGKVVVVPKSLPEMSKLSPKNEATWSYEELQELGTIHGALSLPDSSVFNVFFLKGRAEGNPNVIGAHLSGTKTLVIFKEVVASSDPGILVQRYVEQATLVHEMGHAVGLVNNGLPMTSSHEDTSHVAHCNNPECVMFWQNEGAGSLVKFINTRINNPSLVMLDNACLKDVTSHK